MRHGNLTLGALTLLACSLFAAFAAPRPAAGQDTTFETKIQSAREALGEGRFGDAIAALEPVLEQRPEDPSLLAALARSQMGLGRFGTAEATVQRLAEAAGAPAGQHQCFVAQVWMLAGDEERLRQTLDSVRALDEEGSEEAVSCLGALAIWVGNWEEAIAAIERFRRAAPGAHPPLAYLALAYKRAGRDEDAWELVRTYRAERQEQIEEDPASVEAHYTLAELAALEGDAGAAVAHLRDAVRYGADKRYWFYWAVAEATGGDPIFDEIRGDPDFEAFVAELPAPR